MKKSHITYVVSVTLIMVCLFLITMETISISGFSIPTHKDIISHHSKAETDEIENITLPEKSNRPGKTGFYISVTNEEEAKRLNNYARIQNLSISNIDASILPDLSGLQINGLDLSNVDNIDMTVFDMKTMYSLHLSDSDVKKLDVALSSAYNLSSLHLSSVTLDNLSFLSNSKSLYSLSVKDSKIGDFSAVKAMENLGYLDIINCGLKDISFISNLTKLEVLDISSNHITDISPTKSMTKLGIINASNNNISGTVDLSSLPVYNVNLKFNNIQEVKFNTETDYVYTDLSYNNITKIGENLLKDIKSEKICVNLFGNMITNGEVLKGTPAKFTNQNNIDFTAKQHMDYVNEVTTFINTYIDPNWSDNKKAMMTLCLMGHQLSYFYDYSSSNKPEAQYVHSEYGAMCNKLAVCDGFAYAYRDILKQLGIESYIYLADRISKDDFTGHAWNIIKLGDKYYHCDVTDAVGVLLYNYSDDYLKKYLEEMLYSFGQSDQELIKESYYLEDDAAPSCPTSFDDNKVYSFIDEVVSSDDKFFFITREQYEQAKSEETEVISVE